MSGSDGGGQFTPTKGGQFQRFFHLDNQGNKNVYLFDGHFNRLISINLLKFNDLESLFS